LVPSKLNPAKVIWAAVGAGVVYAAAAARSQKGFAPLAFAGLTAYLITKAMDNNKDYISLKVFGSKDAIPF
jgi:hypothetical protein